MDLWIFGVGLVTFGLLIAGVVITFLQFRRLERRYPDG
jgi:hypothetical protein